MGQMARQKPGEKTGTLIICCGAVAREIITMIDANGWDDMRVDCLPAHLHNDPGRIPEGVRRKIRANRDLYDRIVVLYSDCGTGGQLEAMLNEEGVESIKGAHCYEVFAGADTFAAMMKAEPGSFFLTDFLAQHFERLVVKGLALDRYPELRSTYFVKYKKLVYLAQSDDLALKAKAEAAAETLSLEFEMRFTGYGDFEKFLREQRR